MENKNELEKRVLALEKKVNDLEEGRLRQGRATDVEKPEYVPEPSAPREPGPISHFFKWLKEDWLMKLGAFLLILALVWFVKYAFANDWIGPVGRVSLGMLTGAGLLIFGHFLVPKRRIPGEVLVLTGMIIAIASVFSGYSFYDFFNEITSLGFVSLIILFVAAIAILRDSKALGFIAVVGTASTPFFIDKILDFQEVYLAYLLLINLGVLLMVLLKGWRGLILLSFLITAVYASGIFEVLQHQEGLSIVWAFMGVYYALFLVSNVIAILRNKKIVWTDIAIAGLNSMIALAWILEFVPEHLQSVVLSSLAVLSLISVFLIVQFTKSLKSPIFLYSAAAVLFVGAATAAELEGMAMVVAYFIEILTVVVLGAYFLRERVVAAGASLLNIIPLFLLVDEGSFELYKWADVSLFNEHFFGILVGLVTVLSCGFILNWQRKITKSTNVMFEGLNFVVAAGFAIALLWLSLHNLIESASAARGTALVIMTLVGVSLLFYSLQKDKKGLNVASLVLLGGVVLRLLLLEVWNMPLAGRVVTFLLVGVLLIVTAFFRKRLYE